MTARWITAAVLLLTSAVAAQEQERVWGAGDKVRVTAPSVSERPLIGTYRGVRDDDNLMLAVEATGDPLAIPATEVEKLEISLGRKSAAQKGAWIGGGLGFLVGAVFGAGLCSADFGGGQGDCEPLWAALGGGAVVGIPLAAIGLGIGSLFKSERWEPVALPAKPTVGVHPSGRFNVGVSIPLRR